MNSFKKFLNDKQKEEHSLLKEMSLRNDESEKDIDVLNDPFKNKLFCKQIRKFGTFISTIDLGFFSDIEVWHFPTNSSLGLKFLKGDFVFAVVDYQKIDDNSIQIVFINSFRQQKGLLSYIFVDYLLSGVEKIISDRIQTTSAFNFYKNLFLLKGSFKNNYKVGVLNVLTGEEKEVHNVANMIKTFGDEAEHYNTAYTVTKI